MSTQTANEEFFRQGELQILTKEAVHSFTDDLAVEIASDTPLHRGAKMTFSITEPDSNMVEVRTIGVPDIYGYSDKPLTEFSQALTDLFVICEKLKASDGEPEAQHLENDLWQGIGELGRFLGKKTDWDELIVSLMRMRISQLPNLLSSDQIAALHQIFLELRDRVTLPVSFLDKIYDIMDKAGLEMDNMLRLGASETDAIRYC